MSIASIGEAIENPSVTQLLAAYPTKEAFDAGVQAGKIKPTTEAGIAANIFNRIVQSALVSQAQPQTTVFQDNTKSMGIGAPQPQPQQAAGISQIPVREDMFEEPQGMASGGIVAFQAGGSRKLDPKVAALMQANPGMTASQAVRLLARIGPTAVFGTGLAATDALMATDTGAGQAAAMGSGYDYAAEEMAGGRPDIPVGTTGERSDSPGFMDYLRAVGLAPREQKVDPTTGKFVDVPSKELFTPATPGLAGVLDRPVPAEGETPAAGAAPKTPSEDGAPRKASPRKAPSETALITEEGGKLLPRQGLSVEDFKARQKAFGISDNVDADLKKQIDELAAGTKSEREQAKYMAMLQAGLGIMGGTSPYALQNIGTGAQKGLAQYASDIKDIKKEERDLVKLRGELARAEDARKRGDFKTFQDANEKAQSLEISMFQAQSGRMTAEAQQKIAAARATGAGITLNQMANLRMKAEKEVDPASIRNAVAKEKKLSKIPKPGENKKFDEAVDAAYEAEIERRVNRALGGSTRGSGGAGMDLSGYRIVPEDGE